MINDMNINNIAQHNGGKNQILNQTNITEVELKQTQSEQPNVPHVAIEHVNIVGLLLVSWLSIFLILTKLSLNIQLKHRLKITSFQKIPCNNCQFFNKSHYLQCAVQPTLVMTKEAANCSDYCPKKHNFFSKDKKKK
jgi:hypothetical protein